MHSYELSSMRYCMLDSYMLNSMLYFMLSSMHYFMLNFMQHNVLNGMHFPSRLGKTNRYICMSIVDS
jgi:hypothetical protein